MPEQSSTISFNNFSRHMRIPFIVYTDFESFIKPIDTCEPNPEELHKAVSEAHPSSFCCYIKCFDDEVFSQNPVTYTAESDDEDVGKEEQTGFEDATTCWICHGGFDENDKKVRDHGHFSGKYRGAAHNKCNLQYKKPKFIPIVFHNLSGYDSHLFIKKLGKTEGNINCIPNNYEKYISFK